MEGIVNKKGVSCVSCGKFVKWDKVVKTDDGNYCQSCGEDLEIESLESEYGFEPVEEGE